MTEKMKILIVESDQKILMAMSDGLKQQGQEVVWARDAVYALNVAREARPDAVVLNSRLAGGGGLAALKRIRSNVNTAHIPVIALVETENAREREQMLAAGAQECVAQREGANVLQAAIGRHLLQSLDFTQAPAEVIADPKRLAALKETGLLDSPQDASFDQLAQLASRLLAVPTALMSFVDKDRQFFKSQVGLAHPWAAARQTRLSHSFCQWVVSGQEEVVIEDARVHPVLRSNLAIKDLGVIAYAGVPVHAKAGEAIGSLCAIDSKPHIWSEDDLATLQDLARVTEAFALLQQPGQDVLPGGTEANLQACGSALQGLTRVLQRHATHLKETDRTELLELIRQKGRQLLQFAG